MVLHNSTPQQELNQRLTSAQITLPNGQTLNALQLFQIFEMLKKRNQGISEGPNFHLIQPLINVLQQEGLIQKSTNETRPST